MTAKRLFIRISHLLSAVLVAGSLYAAQSEANVASTFTGEIMDSLCAKTGSHDQMMQDMKSMGRDKGSCSVQCIRLGAKYVLYDSAKRAIYQLDDQEKAAEFAGQKVHVSGTLQKMKIKVAEIERANP
ncbi:MAG: hypothetical protein ABSD75_11425 [Terriglobales bacterium]|jgi:tRNA threonylcarbamoyladenosine modification (KEOPS) complex Cgi121 subunit